LLQSLLQFFLEIHKENWYDGPKREGGSYGGEDHYRPEGEKGKRKGFCKNA
jgi:hypothetical protein